MKEALYYKQLTDNKVKCLLCPKGCVINPNAHGFCRIRENRDGRLYAIAYNKVSSLAYDPIEKKPLFHFYPGSYILSLGVNGCNLSCQFCQNWQLSQGTVATEEITPAKIVDMATRHNSIGIAYTYSEPLIWYEYVKDTARLAKVRGLVNVLVTNGEINEAPLRELLPYIDALNIDLKSIRDSFYQKICGGRLAPVLRTIEIAKDSALVEVTNLIIPSLNDSEEDLRELIDWVAAVDTEIPLHFSRYFPHYKLSQPPTPIATLEQARRLAQQKLKFVYLGNIADKESSSTRCPNCGKLVIIRDGYSLLANHVHHNQCDFCGTKINVVTT